MAHVATEVHQSRQCVLHLERQLVRADDLVELGVRRRGAGPSAVQVVQEVELAALAGLVPSGIGQAPSRAEMIGCPSAPIRVA